MIKYSLNLYIYSDSNLNEFEYIIIKQKLLKLTTHPSVPAIAELSSGKRHEHLPDPLKGIAIGRWLHRPLPPDRRNRQLRLQPGSDRLPGIAAGWAINHPNHAGHRRQPVAGRPAGLRQRYGLRRQPGWRNQRLQHPRLWNLSQQLAPRQLFQQLHQPLEVGLQQPAAVREFERHCVTEAFAGFHEARLLWPHSVGHPAGLQVLVYNGQDDLIVPTPGTVTWVERLSFNGAAAFKAQDYATWGNSDGSTVFGYKKV